MITLLHRGLGHTVDLLLCASLAVMHRRHARRVSTREEAENYVAACERQTRAEHFAVPQSMEDFRQEAPDTISWRSSARSVGSFPVNGRVRATLFMVRREAPTVVFLHSLMSVSDAGYRFWAKRFNAVGWNAAFVHLPFHYSRRPAGHLHGELCCTSDLVLTGDTVRQAVVDVRQLLAYLRLQGSREFGLLGTSYGGWVAALVSSLEADLRFVALLAPLVNLGSALYEGPTSWTIRKQLAQAGLERTLIDRHAHLSSPLRAPPAADAAKRTVIIGGTFDRIVPMADLVELRNAWPGSELVAVPQAHYGHSMIPRVMAWLRERNLLELNGS